MIHPHTSKCIVEISPDMLQCKNTGQKFKSCRQPIFCCQGNGPFPPLTEQAWNLATSLAAFMVDGCRTVDTNEYAQRLVICDQCEHRRKTRCVKCGCNLALKAKGRAFKCPEDKWPEQTGSSQTGDCHAH